MRGGDHPLDGNTWATLPVRIYKGQKVYKGGQGQLKFPRGLELSFSTASYYWKEHVHIHDGFSVKAAINNCLFLLGRLGLRLITKEYYKPVLYLAII